MTANNIKVVSFDIFQTLVDVNNRIPQIWAGILGEDYTEEKANFGAKAILEAYPNAFTKTISSDTFNTLREIYMDCAESVIKKTGYDVAPEDIVESLLYQHSQAPLYDDVIRCMQSLRKHYRIVLSSDADRVMIDELVKALKYDQSFISEDLNSYKGNPDGKFFTQVIEQLGVQPNEIIHIGDGIGDVLGAHRAGIVSCWLNRDSIEWNHIIQPDYTINSLFELSKILLP